MVNAAFIQRYPNAKRAFGREQGRSVLTLAEYRTKHGITQPEMAQMLGVSAQSISRWERGICMPRLYIIERIEKITNGAVTYADWRRQMLQGAA